MIDLIILHHKSWEDFKLPMSISMNPSADSASGVDLSIVSKHRAASCGSSNRRAWVSNINALSAHRWRLRKSTQCFSSAGTAYFLAVYKVVITVSGPICTSSEYRKRKSARNEAGSTSGRSISSSEMRRNIFLSRAL